MDFQKFDHLTTSEIEKLLESNEDALDYCYE